MKEHLIENYKIPISSIQRLPLTESKKIIHEGKEYIVPEGFEMPMWDVSKKNRNGRRYPIELAQKIVINKIVTPGLADHPEDQGSVDKIFAIENNPHLKGNVLYYDLYPVYPYKEKIKDILSVPGGFFECSSSGYGEVLADGTVDPDTYELERYGDFVLNRSEECAIFYGDNKLGESLQEMSYSHIDDIFRELDEKGIKLDKQLVLDIVNLFEEGIVKDYKYIMETYDISRFDSERIFSVISKYFGIKENIKESIDDYNIGDKVKYNNTFWKITKKNSPEDIEVRKANNDFIFKRIALNDIQENVSMKENKLKETIDHAAGGWSKEELDKEAKERYNKEYGELTPEEEEKIMQDLGESYKIKEENKDDEIEKLYKLGHKAEEIASLLNINIEDVKKSIIDNSKKYESYKENKKEGNKTMSKRYNVEEKSIRLSIKNLIKEADQLKDLEEKLNAYNEILEWFEGDFANDLKEDVDKKIGDLNEEIKFLAKKGLQVDFLKENEKKINSSLEEITESYKKLSEKYDVAVKLLDNMKIFSTKMKDLYESQKLKVNGMATASEYKQALTELEEMKKSIEENQKSMEKITSENKTLNENLSKVKSILDEKNKFDAIRKKQVEMTKLYKEYKLNEEKKVQESKIVEGKKKLTEDRIKNSISVTEDSDVKEYFEDLLKENKKYMNYKDKILGCKTLVEAQKFVIDISDKIYEEIEMKREKVPSEKKLTENSYKFTRETRKEPSAIKVREGWF